PPQPRRGGAARQGGVDQINNSIDQHHPSLGYASAFPSSAEEGSRNRSFPINGEIHADYSAASQQLSLNQSFLKLPQTTVNLNGTISQRAAGLQVQFQSNDLSEIETVADAFGATTLPLGLGGTATFNGTVRGSTTAPQING